MVPKARPTLSTARSGATRTPTSTTPCSTWSLPDDGPGWLPGTRSVCTPGSNEFGAYFQARLADELRRLGARVSYDQNEQAVVLDAIPEAASEAFSSRTADVTRAAKRYADQNGHDWDGMSVDQKNKMVKMSSLATRLRKSDANNDKAAWRERAEAIGWDHTTVLKETDHAPLSDNERFDRAYEFAARHLAKEFHTAAVIDHDRLRLLATRGLIGCGIAGGPQDINRVVALIEERGIKIGGEHVALIQGASGDTVRVTHTAQVRIEESLAAQARRAALDRSGGLSEEAIKAAIDASGLDLSGEQGRAQKAAIYALGKGGGLSLLTGVAGAGKTTLLQPLVRAWQADTRFGAGGREVVGISTAWRQADALRDASITVTRAMTPFLSMVEKGEFQPTRNTVLVIDEVGQVAPRHMLKLLELQRDTGMTIKVLGDREQAQSIEAGDVIEIMRRMLPREEMPELLSTVRQITRRNREIAGLFRGREPELDELAAVGSKARGRKIQGAAAEPGRAGAEDEFRLRQTFHLGEVKQALSMKREDGTARMVGGDHDEVLAEIAGFYMSRRDALRASGARIGITMSALTNQDAADLSRAVRALMKARGELGTDERVIQAVDQRGEQYDMAIATGDKVRLYRRTFGLVDGKKGYIGNNGDIVEVLGFTSNGIRLRGDKGRVAEIDWRQFRDQKTGRALIGFGHAMTIDAAQGMTSDEHINALPRGVGSMTGFTAYVAESRARGTSWTMVADGATFEAVRNKRAIGDLAPVTSEDLWDHVAAAMATKPYKALGMDLAALAREDRARAAETLMRVGHLAETMQAQGRSLGREIRMRQQADAVRQYLPKHIAALDAAIARNLTAGPRMSSTELHLRTVRVDAEDARRTLARILRRA